MRDSLKWVARLSIIISILLSVFLLIPILVILPASLNGGEFIAFPPESLSLRWYETIFTNPSWTSAFIDSLRFSVTAAIIATIIGTLAALGVRRLDRSAGMVQTLMLVPLILPLVTYALGLSLTVNIFGLDPNTPWPTILGQATLAVPLAFISISAGLSTVDPAGVRAAQSMGASWVRVVREIEIPQVLPSVFGGAVLAFAYCFDEIVVALFLSSEGVRTLPVQIYQTVTQSVSPAVAAASTVVVLVALLVAAAAAVGQRMLSRRMNKRRSAL